MLQLLMPAVVQKLLPIYLYTHRRVKPSGWSTSSYGTLWGLTQTIALWLTRSHVDSCSYWIHLGEGALCEGESISLKWTVSPNSTELPLTNKTSATPTLQPQATAQWHQNFHLLSVKDTKLCLSALCRCDWRPHVNKGGSDHGFSPGSLESLALGPEVMQSIMAVGTCGGGVIHPMVMTEHREEGGERGRESTLLS